MALAIASALMVLIASGAAVSRLGSDRSGRDRSDTASASDPGALSGRAAGNVSGPAPVDTSGALSSASAPVPPPVPASGTARVRTGRSRTKPSRGGQAAGAPAAAVSAPQPVTGGAPDGTAAGSGGTANGSDASPSPQGTPEPSAVAASASVGEGTNGAVVGLGLGDRPDADVTLGTTPVLGNAPPSRGTGIGIGGHLLHPPPTIPILPG